MPSTRLMILDSGAFSVWTQGVEIDLDSYIRFCAELPDCSYYVSLDVIPGKPGDKSTLTKDSVEASCQQGWANYRRMTATLGSGKVIPVFHQGDHVKWLERYLEMGVEYIGISPANDRRSSGSNARPALGVFGDKMTTKLQWLRSLRKYLFDGAGRPTVKTHGFAVTSYDLIKAMEWHSVDSASWKLAGAWGDIYLPRGWNTNRLDFTKEPEHFRASANFNPGKDGMGHKGRPRVPQRVLDWLQECKVKVGSFIVKQADANYKLNREAKEIWFHKIKRVVLVPIEHGVVTSVEQRLRVNAEFMFRANKALREYVKHIYFAGALMPYELEYQLGKRLLSYAHTKTTSGLKVLEKHCQLVSENRKGK